MSAQASAYQVGTFCWNELVSTDIEAAKRFYAELFGWKLRESEVGGMKYAEIVVGERAIGGMCEMGAEFGESTSRWLSYVVVENVDETVKRVEQLGGKVSVLPTDIPEIGRFAVIHDPSGGVISVITLK